MTKPRATWALLATIVLLTGYRFWLVDHSGITLFLDESQYWDWSRELAWGYYSKPPVIAWLIAATTAVFGDGLLGVKAGGMLVYPLTTLLIWGCGREMFGERAGWVAALAFITSPLVALLGLFVSTDAPLLFCWALATWAGWRALQPRAASTALPPWGAWVVLGLALGLGALSKYTLGALLPGLLWAWWRWRPRLPVGLQVDASVAHAMSESSQQRWQGTAVTAVIALACVLPHVAWNLRMGSPTLRHTMEITATAHREGGFGALAEFIGGQMLILGPVASVALLLALGRPLQRHGRLQAWAATREGQATTYLLALALPLLAIATVQAFNAHAHVNWAAPAYVSAVLLLGRVLATRPRWFTASVAFNLLVVLLVTQAADLAHLAGRPLPAKLDAFARMRGYDTAYDQLRPAVQARPGWRVVSHDRSLLAQAAYQWRDLGVRPYAWNPQHRADNHYELSTDFDSQRGCDALFLTVEPLPPETLERFASLDEVQQARVEIAPGRIVTVRLYALRGFMGYR